jgi:hypothetical protein
MRYLIRDTSDHRRVAHYADEASLWTAHPRALCGCRLSPRRWNVADELGEYRIRCIRCERWVQRELKSN